MKEILLQEVKEFLNDKGFECTEERIERYYGYAIEHMKNPYYSQPCQDCDNPIDCEKVKVWYCPDQK